MMTAMKTLAIGIVVGMITPTWAAADSMSSPSSWVFFGGGPDSRRPFSPPTSFLIPLPASAPVTTYTTQAPAPTPAVVSTSVSSTPTPVSTSAISSPAPTPISATSTGAPEDAYINLGTTTPQASTLTTGVAQPWYDSPAVEKVYGGNVPTASQQASFTNMVLNDVKQTFAASGLNPTVTTDPSIPANHTLSVVSGQSYAGNVNTIGITDVGHNGFSFIDKFTFANTPEELATALSKNISHELMHAFGVGKHPDTTGNYIDAATVSTSLLTNPNATFSPGAVSLIQQAGYGRSVDGATGAQSIDGEQQVTPVPEPATFALWTLGCLAGLIAHRRRASKSA